MKTKFGIIAVVAIIVIVSIGAVLINYNLEEGNLRFYWYGTELEEWVPR